MRLLIVLILSLGSSLSVLAQDGEEGVKTINSELKLVIYEGDAYKKWYRFSVNSKQRLRQLSEKKQDANANVKRLLEKRESKLRKSLAKANKKESKAKTFSELIIPFNFEVVKGTSEDLPWKALTMNIANDTVFENNEILVEATLERVENYTEQYTFQFKIRITNKHIENGNEFQLSYSLTVDFEESKFESVSNNSFVGNIYKNKYPRIYKQDGKTYSFIPFLDRCEEQIRERFIQSNQ